MNVTYYYCDPKLHNGKKIEADYFVAAHRYTEPGETERVWVPGSSFACCELHLPHALEVVIAKSPDGTVLVRREKVAQ